MRAAASSMASGSPSSRAQISATTSVTSKSGRTAAARSANSATASSRADRGGTAYSVSPYRFRCVRLVARIVSPGAAASSSVASGVASSRCSRLSSTSSSSRSAKNALSASSIDWPRLCCSASACAIACGTQLGVRHGRERHEAGPVGELAGDARAPTSSASRVLPVPPGAGERQQAHAGSQEQRPHLLELAAAADERRQRAGQLGPAAPREVERRDRARGSAARAPGAPRPARARAPPRASPAPGDTPRARRPGGPTRYSASIS